MILGLINEINWGLNLQFRKWFIDIYPNNDTEKFLNILEGFGAMIWE